MFLPVLCLCKYILTYVLSEVILNYRDKAQVLLNHTSVPLVPP